MTHHTVLTIHHVRHDTSHICHCTLYNVTTHHILVYITIYSIICHDTSHTCHCAPHMSRHHIYITIHHVCISPETHIRGHTPHNMSPYTVHDHLPLYTTQPYEVMSSYIKPLLVSVMCQILIQITLLLHFFFNILRRWIFIWIQITGVNKSLL